MPGLDGNINFRNNNNFKFSYSMNKENNNKLKNLMYGFTIILFSMMMLLIGCSKKNLAASQNEQPSNMLTSAEIAEGWELLFDGKSTEKWRGYNHQTFPNIGWHIDDEGNLAVEKTGTEEEGFGGDIITKEQYENFHLKVDFMVSDTGNSGILYRVIEHDGDIWNNAPEYQILDDDTYIAMETMDMKKHLTGDNYDLHSSAGSYSNDVGQWNTAEIVLINNKVEHWLNGHKTVEYHIESPEWNQLVAASKFSEYPDYGRSIRGHIGLQDHGHLIKFRNIKIKKLPSSYVNIFNGKNLNGWIKYGTEKWYVENGVLVCESGPDKQYGYLGTEEEYKDFDLSLEFMQEANGNSGVFFRSSIEGTKITGWQAEVAPPGMHTGGIYESYGRGWLIQPEAGSDDSLKMGKWNKMRVQVKGDKVTTWLNGRQMITFSDAKIGEATGKIALQIHDGGGIKVKWKNLMVKEI